MQAKELTAAYTAPKIRLSRKQKMTKIYNQRYLLFMLLPALICITLFSYAPIFGWVMAFTDYQVGLSMWSAPFVGLKHFKEFFMDSGEAFGVIRNTLVMNVLSLLIGLFLALVFAILLREVNSKRLQKSVQYATFLPYFMSWVILYAVVYSLFSVSNGAINETLMALHIISKPLNILGDPKYSWALIVGVNTWNSLGYNSVIFIAAIAGIPQEQYEAAEIDGAGRWAKIINITVPNLIPTLMVLLIMNTGWLLNNGLDQYFIFTNSMNMEKMEVFDYYIYRYGLKLFNYSYATAVSIIKTGVSILLLIIVNRVSKKNYGRSLF